MLSVSPSNEEIKSGQGWQSSRSFRRNSAKINRHVSFIQSLINHVRDYHLDEKQLDFQISYHYLRVPLIVLISFLWAWVCSSRFIIGQLKFSLQQEFVTKANKPQILRTLTETLGQYCNGLYYSNRIIFIKWYDRSSICMDEIRFEKIIICRSYILTEISKNSFLKYSLRGRAAIVWRLYFSRNRIESFLLIILLHTKTRTW